MKWAGLGALSGSIGPDIRVLAVVSAGLCLLRVQEIHEPDDLAGRIRFSLDLSLDHESTHLACEHGDDQDPDLGDLPTEGDGLSLGWVAEWRDENRSLSGVRPVSFDRTYSVLSLSIKSSRREAVAWERIVTSALERIRHRWGWNGRERRYEISELSETFLEDGALESLASDLTFTWILPGDGTLEEAPIWRLSVEDLVQACWPGGFGRVGNPGRDSRTEETVHAVVVPGLPRDAGFWSSATTGSVAARLLEHLRADEGDVAVIGLQFELSGSQDPKNLIKRALGGDEADLNGYVEMMQYGGEGLEWTIRGDGEVRWSIDGGHMISVELGGEVEVRSNLTWSYEWDAPQIERFFGDRSETWTGHFEVSGESHRAEGR